MKLTHLGHACLLVEYPDTRVLIDPGVFSEFTDVRDVDAILVTHQHADHLDTDKLEQLRSNNPNAVIHTDPETAKILQDSGVNVETNAAGQGFDLGSVRVTPIGQLHAEIHPYIPRITNLGVLLSADGEPTLFHPGDALDGQPLEHVDILAVPVSGPWASVKETIAFVRRIAPDRIVPIHDCTTSEAGRSIYLQHIGNFGLDGGVPVVDLRGEPATELTA